VIVIEETNELKQLPEIENIAAYLRGMTFRKKAFGGCDIESVYEHFSAVTQMYEDIIRAYMQQAEQHTRQLAELQARLAPPLPPPVQQPVQQPYMNPWMPPYAPWAQLTNFSYVYEM